MKKKKIYISYSWDDQGNIERVEELVFYLRQKINSEYDIIFDKEIFDKETQDVNRFIVDNIIDAEIVIIFITESYVEKADKSDDGYGNGKNERSGVEIETSYLLDRRHQREKSIISVLLDGKNRPKYLKGLSFIYGKTDNDIIKILEKRIEEFEKEKYRKSESSNNNFRIVHKSNIDKIDIEFSFEDEPTRVVGRVWINESYFVLEHYQIINLFEKIISEDILNNYKDKNIESFYSKCFLLEFNNHELYEKFIIKIKSEIDIYLKKLLEFEAKYEIYSRYPMNKNYEFKLATMDKNIWIQMIEFANTFDWGNGKSKWNIFQMNDYFIHVFFPVISYNEKYDSGEHAILYGRNKENFYSDDVDVYLKIKDIVYNSEKNKIDIRNAWSVDMVFDWLKEEFVPFFCNKKGHKGDGILFEECNQHKEDIFSQAQEFYMSNKVVVKKEELESLREVLIFCLNKKSVGEDSHYIKSKLGISGNSETNEEIKEYIKSYNFTEYLMNSNNNRSIADDMLRCIKSFTDNYSTHKINENDIEHCARKIHSLVEKMRKIKLLKKYEY